jgi:uncharacterized protein YukE
LAGKGTTSNGRNRLDEALATLIQNQAAFVGQMAANDRRHAEFDERFARIESKMNEIIRVLSEHGRLLERLPEAVRDKIGFRSGPQ